MTSCYSMPGWYLMLEGSPTSASNLEWFVSQVLNETDPATGPSRHARGDDVLRAVSDALRQTFRDTDLLVRVGGDEFCVIAEAEVGTDPAVLVARLDEAIAAAGRGLGLDVVLSHGEVTTDWRGLDDPSEILARADAHMYADKRERARGDSG